jgi:hypothetical protein
LKRTQPRQIFLDFGGTDLKFSLGSKSEPVRLNVSKLLKQIGNYKFYLASDLQEFLYKVVEKHLPLKVETHFFISTQMASAYDLTSLEETNVILSWQSRSSADLGTVFQNAFIESGRDLRSSSPVFTVPDFLFENFNTKSHGLISLDTLGGFVADTLLGHRTKVRHCTDAFSLGAYKADITFGRISDFARIEVPQISKEVVSLGTSELMPNATIFAPVGDQQTSLLGVQLSEVDICVNMGTGGQVAVLNIANGPDSSTKAQQRPYFDSRWLSTFTHLPSGRTLSAYFLEWHKYFGGKFEDFLKLAGQEKPVSYEISSRVPIDYDEFSAVDKHLLRELLEDESPAVLPSIVANKFINRYEELILQLPDFSKREKLVFAGGLGSRFPYMQQELSRKLDLPLELRATTESTINGLWSIASSLEIF